MLASGAMPLAAYNLQATNSRGAKASCMSSEEHAIELLLRSPRFDIEEIMELFDIGDREFRELARTNPTIARLLKERRLGTLEPLAVQPHKCGVCGEWFLPYGADKQCSDPCKRTAQSDRLVRAQERKRTIHASAQRLT